MAKDLQSSGHHERDYNRPNCKWTCGHSPEGRECPLGPSAGGGCRGTGECLPIMRGDRWFCSRPTARGGECEAGPDPNGKCGCGLAPCKPQRTLRDRRKLCSVGLVVLTIGALIAILRGGASDPVINAGQLTTAHAGENLTCTSCHTEPSLAGLEASRGAITSQKCLECHGDEIGDWDETARFAHGWSPENHQHHVEKAAIADATTSKNLTQVALWIAAKGPLPEQGENGQLDCATCHQEHHGADFSLTVLTNQQCQVCHQNQFHGFGEGHPTFAETGYPYSRRTRIFFDHGTHYQKHFEENSEFFDTTFDPENPLANSQTCNSCHQVDSKGEFMKLAGFEASCAACHADAVSGGDALTLFAIPEIDQEIDMGKWPRSSYGLIPSMRWLLAQTPTEDLDSEDEFGSVWIADAESTETATHIASDLQTLFHDAWQEGQESLSMRLTENGFGDAQETRKLLAGLSSDTLRRFLFPGTPGSLGDLAFPALDLTTLDSFLGKTQQRSVGAWPESAAPLTGLMQHLLAHRPEMESVFATLLSDADELGSLDLGDLSKSSPEELAAVEQLAWEIKSLYAELQRGGAPFLEQFDVFRGGILDLSETEAILDEVFLNATAVDGFDATVKAELQARSVGIFPSPVLEKAAPTPTAIGTGDDDFGTEDDDFGAKSEMAADDNFGEETKAAVADDDFGTEDDDFGVEPEMTADDDFGEETKAAAADDDFGTDDDEFGTEPKMEASADTEINSTKKLSLFEPDPAEWQIGGGWFYENHAIRYRSRGHADPLISAWIEAAVNALNSEDPKIAKNGRLVLDHTLQWKDGVLANGSGQCFKCHTVDKSPETDQYRINWFAAYGSDETVNPSSELTRFSHQKHFIALDCQTCHVVDTENDYTAFFPARGSAKELTDPMRYSSNFLPINEKMSCANCHQDSAAGNRCLQCHEYHSHFPSSQKGAQ